MERASTTHTMIHTKDICVGVRKVMLVVSGQAMTIVANVGRAEDDSCD